MKNVWTDNRQARIVIELLTRTDEKKSEITTATGGSVEFTQNTRLRGSGSLTLVDAEDVDWLSDRVRVSYQIDGGSIGLGVWLLSAPTMRSQGDSKVWDIDLLSKLSILDEDAVDRPFSLPPGTVVTRAVEDLIVSAGETNLSVTGSTEKTTSALVWEAGTPKLTIINDLLASINYFSLWIDGAGQFRVEPYERPGARLLAWEFKPGVDSVHLDAWERDQDTTGVPNRVVVVSQPEGEEEALRAVAENNNPDSPFSFQARGRWVTYVETGVEASSQKVLDSLAQRRLVDRSSPVANIEISNLPLPLNPGDAVSFEHDGHRVFGVVQKWSMSLEPTALAKTTIREVLA